MMKPKINGNKDNISQVGLQGMLMFHNQSINN